LARSAMLTAKWVPECPWVRALHSERGNRAAVPSHLPTCRDREEVNRARSHWRETPGVDDQERADRSCRDQGQAPHLSNDSWGKNPRQEARMRPRS